MSEMLLSRLFSSTKASGHTSAINSSLLTRWPSRRTSVASVSKAFSVKGTRAPSLRDSKRSAVSRRNAPNTYKWLSCWSMATFRNAAERFQDSRRTLRATRYSFSAMHWLLLWDLSGELRRSFYRLHQDETTELGANKERSDLCLIPSHQNSASLGKLSLP